MSDNPTNNLTPSYFGPGKINRRKFLFGALTGAALISLPGFTLLRNSKRFGSGPDWNQLERNLKGKLLRPDVDGYSEAIKIWNLRYASTRPAGVAMVADAKEMATAIAWAHDNQVEMVARSGGHSYAGYSTTPGLVINLQGMTNVTVNIDFHVTN